MFKYNFVFNFKNIIAGSFERTDRLSILTNRIFWPCFHSIFCVLPYLLSSNVNKCICVYLHTHRAGRFCVEKFYTKQGALPVNVNINVNVNVC